MTEKDLEESSFEGAVYEAETDDYCICTDVRGSAAVGIFCAAEFSIYCSTIGRRRWMAV